MFNVFGTAVSFSACKYVCRYTDIVCPSVHIQYLVEHVEASQRRRKLAEAHLGAIELVKKFSFQDAEAFSGGVELVE